MWVPLLVVGAMAVAPPSSPGGAVSWVDVVAGADDAPVAVAAAAGARALQDASGRLAPMDGLRSELQPGTQFRPFDAITSPAAQLVIEATSGAGTLLGARRDQNRNDAAVLDAEAEAVRLQRRLQLSDAWCDRKGAELAEAAARTALADAQQLQGRLERLQGEPAAGLVVAIDDLIAVRAVVAEATLAVLDAEAARLEAGLRLGRLLGRDGEVATAGPLPTPASVPASLPASPEGPGVARAAAAVAAARAALLAHERELWPTVGLGMQVQIDDARTGFAYGRLSISLPRVDGDPRGRAELLARLQFAEAELIEQRRGPGPSRSPPSAASQPCIWPACPCRCLPRSASSPWLASRC